MKLLKRSAKVLLLGAAISSVSALADTGVLRVKITDSAGNPVAGAVVDAQTAESLTGRKGVTDENGEVKLVGLDPSAKYEVVVSGEGYQTIKSQNVLVVSGQSFSLSYTLENLSSDIEEVMVMGRPVQLVDTTSAIVGQDITLDLTESLPTGRDYQSYLQLAPGTKPSAGGNPSSKSGVNYSDAVDSDGRTSGVSTDNVYYIDGVNVTDNRRGISGGNVNSEIIQEQHVLTGGIPAEYEGGSGLVSRVVTKSGSNEWHGSVNYYFQNDDLVADNKHINGNGFSTFDTAFTLGGPIIEDKLWFYSSYQIKNREDDIFDPITGEKLRTVNTDEDLGFLKLTWQATDTDKLIVSFFNDPYEKDGSEDSTVVANRDRATDKGGDNYMFKYSHTWENLILTLDAARHEGEFSRFAADKSSRNDVAYLNYNPTNAETDLGGYGSDLIETQKRDTFAASLEWFLDTNWGGHDIKFGITQTKNELNQNSVFAGDGAQYTSIGANNRNSTLDDYVNSNLPWTGARDLTKDDLRSIIQAMNESADKAYYLSLLDSNGDSSISEAELRQLQFGSTEGNPNDMVNVYRIMQVEAAPVTFETEGLAFYLQDSWNYGNWTVNAGVRYEEWDHFASDGSKIFTFDAEVAPRLSVVYDINGNGDSKVWSFWGRYYDPIRTDMTSFAGTLTGSIREEQVFVGDRWLTFRTRGGRKVQDAIFAPNTKTPYTDEFLIGYSKSLTEDMSIEVTYIDRVTKDLLEDYDLSLYTSAENAGDFQLPLSYFGLPDDFDIEKSNYVIGTLKGGKREYKGVELTFRKRRSDNWQMLASYTYNRAKGNSNSDGNADLQGDYLFLDPRAPGMWGDQPGNIEHLFKVAGSYYWDNGIELGAVYNWNSGMLYSKTYSFYSRHSPVSVDEAYEYGGVTEKWVDGDAVGSQKSDPYGTLDLRLKYTHLFSGYSAEFFLDIFNVLDEQAGIREQDLREGDGVYSFGQDVEWVEPRRFYLGARVSF